MFAPFRAEMMGVALLLYALKTGDCLDDATVKLTTYPARAIEGQVQIQTAGGYGPTEIDRVSR